MSGSPDWQHCWMKCVALLEPAGSSGPLLREDSHRKPADRRVHADGGGAVGGLELHEVRVVAEPGDDLAHVDGLAAIDGHDAQQFVGRKARLGRRRQARFMAVPREASQVFTQRADRVGVVLGEVFGEPRDGRMHQRAAEFFFRCDLAGRCLEQRRTGEEGARAVAHHHDEVRHAGHVGPAGGGAAMHDRQHGNARGRHARETRVVRAAEDEILDAVAQQVGARGLDQVHERQAVLERELLGALEFLEPHGLQCAGFDAGIVDDDHAARAADLADARQQSAARRRLLGVRVVQQVTRAGREFEVGRTRIQQQAQPLARQQLAAPGEPGPRATRRCRRAVAQFVVTRDQRQHVRAVLRAGGARHVQGRFEDRHASHLGDSTRRS